MNQWHCNFPSWHDCSIPFHIILVDQFLGFFCDHKRSCDVTIRCDEWHNTTYQYTYHISELLTTTHTIEGRKVKEYKAIVSGETILGANIFKDFLAGIRDVIGGRSSSYERVLREAKETAMREMVERARVFGADAVVGIDIDYETVGKAGGMLMVSCSGTAVTLE